MLELKFRGDENTWPRALKPKAHQLFEPWWAQNRARLAHLEPRLIEQWVYRHWSETRFWCIPLETLE